MSEILVPIAPADLIDRLTRLELRAQQMESAAAQAAIKRQIMQLQRAADHALPAEVRLQGLWNDLADTNADLFALAADMRNCERRADFGPAFVALARAMIAAQDSRVQIKAEIDALLAVSWPVNRGVDH